MQVEDAPKVEADDSLLCATNLRLTLHQHQGPFVFGDLHTDLGFHETISFGNQVSRETNTSTTVLIDESKVRAAIRAIHNLIFFGSE